jgi:NAD(P)-dependent dehydrogenase (short-subunit alcohol dehydrogenase family)
VVCVKCDVSKEEDVKNAIDVTVKAFGTIHAALASAGIFTFVPTLTSRATLNT